jgi:pimeloyl-ACP methyl ester carboxylesterase
MNGDATRQEWTQTLDGVSLYVTTWGRKTQPERSVLLVHGLTASHQEFAELGPLLAAQGWYAIGPDLRGRGLSSKPPHGYGIPLHVNDLLSLCDRLDLPATAIVGHSLGAAIGAYLAALHPARVSRLVMIDAGGKIPADTAQAIGASVARLGTPYPSLDAYLQAMRQLPMIPEWNDLWEQYFRYDAQVYPDGHVTSRVPRAAIEEENAALALTRTEELPALITQPTLIVRATIGLLGPDRGFILPAEEAARLQALIPGSQLIEAPGTNHYTIILSDVLKRSVADFLALP